MKIEDLNKKIETIEGFLKSLKPEESEKIKSAINTLALDNLLFTNLVNILFSNLRSEFGKKDWFKQCDILLNGILAATDEEKETALNSI
jgi:hypothetical protein